MLSTQIHKIECPRKLVPLLAPRRYKGAYGGRGGAKSHFFAEQIVIRCFAQRVRVVCIREVQSSIKDSVRQLIIDKIEKFELMDSFEVLEAEIRCKKNGSFIIFKGMQSYNAANIKSLEGFDIAWTEEAQTLSQASLDMLIPTIRKEDKEAGTESELWFSWNPRYKTDPVDLFFRKNPPPDAISVLINWRDNPWFPNVLKKAMLHAFEVDRDKADNIWNGAYGSGQGAILSRWVYEAERQGRISDDVVFDPLGSLVEITSDLGFRDTSSWWFWQRLPNGYRLLAYDGDTGLDADDWIERIKEKLEKMKLKLGKIWLPHDAKVKTFQSKNSSVERFIKAFGAEKIDIVPISKKETQINAARTTIKQCEFNKTACEDGLDGLMAWEFVYNDELGVFGREPLHNWASHPSDAFSYGCQVMQNFEKPTISNSEIRGIMIGANTVTLNEMWASQPKQNNRI